MSVTGSATVRRRPFPNALGDPSLPEAIWYAQAAVIGDASGGQREIDIVLNPGGDTRTGRSWSIERVEASDTNAVATAARWLTTNTDVIGPGLTNPIQHTGLVEMPTRASVSNPETAVRPRDMKVGQFIGSQGGSASDANINVATNNVDLQTFAVYMTGYEWGPGALTRGWRRPPDGLLS